MNEERTGKCLRQMKYIRGHLWHRYSITVNHVMVATVKLSTDRSASYIELHLEIGGRLRTKLYDKRDDFNFPIVNFPFICSNIPLSPPFTLLQSAHLSLAGRRPNSATYFIVCNLVLVINIAYLIYTSSYYNVRYNNIIYPSSSKCWLIDEVYIGDRRGRDRTVVEFTIELPVKSMQVITKVVSSHHFQQYFCYIVAVSFVGGWNRSTRRKSPTCRKSDKLSHIMLYRVHLTTDKLYHIMLYRLHLAWFPLCQWLKAYRWLSPGTPHYLVTYSVSR
jgi:hypothetical protein